MTDIYALVDRIRNSYVDAFRDFVEKQHQTCRTGATEVKLQLGGQSKLVNGLYRVDFINSDKNDSDITEFTFDQYFSFSGLRGQLGELSVTFASMRWNDVIIAHDLTEPPAARLTSWFEHWFDPADQRRDDTAEFNKTIHSLLVDPQSLAIDFGTAPSEAFWSLIELLEEAGARTATIHCSK
ncbi:MAG TPA: hypothetical protein VF920_08435 [Dongiaceae bacterium]